MTTLQCFRAVAQFGWYPSQTARATANFSLLYPIIMGRTSNQPWLVGIYMYSMSKQAGIGFFSNLAVSKAQEFSKPGLSGIPTHSSQSRTRYVCNVAWSKHGACFLKELVSHPPFRTLLFSSTKDPLNDSQHKMDDHNLLIPCNLTIAHGFSTSCV